MQNSRAFEHRYEVVTWSRDIGTDERMDFSRKADAIRHARSFVNLEEYAAVYDRFRKIAFVVFGDVETPVFADYVSVRPL